MEPQNQNPDGLTRNVRGFFLHKSTFFRRLFEFPRKFCWVIVKRFQHETTFLGLSYMKLVFETVDWGSFGKALQYDN